MATVLLAVSSNYSASGVVAQGSMDAGFQSVLGAAVPCPGVFPCSIKAKSKVNGGSTGVVESVYAGPNHAVIREALHNYVASAGNTVRLETINRSVKLAGGTYVESLNTPSPVVAPYAGLPNVSLNGLPLEFSAGTFTGAATIADTANPAATGNYYSSSDPYTYTFSDKSFLAESANVLFLNALGNGRPVSINMDAYGGYTLSTYSALQPSNPIQMVKGPVLVNGTDLNDADQYYGTGGNTPASKRSATMFLASENAPVFGCFNSVTGQQNASVFGLQPGLIESLAIYNIERYNGNYVFAGLRKLNGSAYVGQFSAAGTSSDSLNPEFLQFYRSYANCSGLKPAFGFDTAFRSVDSTTGKVNTFWASAYPQGRRLSAYLDVKATQYGFVFLNKATQHLEFMFQPHVEPWFVSPKLQVVNKVVHAPPRSADYYPALNMLLGIDPRTPLTGASLYQQNDATIKSYFADDQITHGGGGHVMAMGTFNGAIVNNGTVAVWGSNRWGQCVIPDALNLYASNGGKLVDVAVSNAPPVFKDDGELYSNNTVYSDDLAEYWARYYSSAYDPATGSRTSYYSYPPRNSERYGQHINFTNLPGHVVVVTQEGWVYAWGNDKYYQCQVPDEISLVDSNGGLKTGAPADPISEVSAGAFHTVARSRNGTVYVWGAGGPWANPTAGTYGRVVGTSTNDLIPSYGGDPNVYGTVHFGQSYLGGSFVSVSHLGIQAPATHPVIGTSAVNSEVYSVSVGPTSIVDLVKSVNGNAVTVGQKTTSGFSVLDPGTPAGNSGRLKGMIAAGAFHTAIIDNALKIQCIGAGKGTMDSTTTDVSSTSQETASKGAAIWGSSYSYTGSFFSTYPHYCQSIDQYRAPLAISGTTAQGVGLFRNRASGDATHKSRYFQNLQFKKVVCGPFTTHGIIYSVDRASTTNPYTAVDKAYLHNRVVSWGCAFGQRIDRGNQAATGPTGLKYTVAAGSAQTGSVSNTDLSKNLTTSYNPSGTIAGTGNLIYLNSVSRYFEIINRAIGTGGIYASQTSLVSAPGTDYSFATTGSVGVIRSSDSSTGTMPLFNTHCPVTISRFKVKDIATCGDYTMFIGFIGTLSQSSAKSYASDTSTQGSLASGATFDYHASVFFTGADYYNTTAATLTDLPGRLHTTNPYAGNNLVRRNKVGTPYVYYGQTGRLLKDKSLYFGTVKQAASISYRLPGDAADTTTVNYVIPTTALASSNLVAAVVNMDNRPVAWSGFFQMNPNSYEAPIDLSLLPSVPIQNFKTGKSHIMAVTNGDWPVAISMGSANNVPKLVTELGSRLFSTTIPSVTIAPNLIYGEPDVYKRPVLIAWGAGDGREYGGTLLAFSSGGSGIGSTFGMHFLDTHAVTRYDATYGGVTGATQPLSAGADNWENYYGEYRWNINSRYDTAYSDPFVEVGSTGGALGTQYGGPQQPTDSAISLPAGHHAVEAMQSLLAFRQDKYPTGFTNPALSGRNLLNGSSVAAIPAAAYMPFVSYAAYPTGTDLKKVVCCATAADEAGSNYASINSLQEFHSPLGYMQQTYTDYVMDYSAGSKHSAVLFSSACPDYTKIADGTFRTSLANFNSYFMSDAAGAIPFGNRRVRKLGIVGYGCENQTAGAERTLGDGNLAPIVPMLFGNDARVYCGDSYTLVTNPIKIHTLTSAATALNLTAGASTSTLTIPISVASSLFSKRIRGLDVILTFTATSASNPLPLTNLTISIPYKGNTWTIFEQIRANLDTTPTTAYVPGGTSTTTYRVSNRFWTPAYQYQTYSGELYSELGSNCGLSSSYTTDGTKYYLKGIDSGATIPALSKQGVYFASSVGTSGTAVSGLTWAFSTNANVVFPFNEPTINVVISDSTNATSYAGYTVTVKLEVEVDAGDVPYVVFGPNRSGVYNELEGSGPSYAADIGALGYDTNRPNVDILSCPCEIDGTIQDRRYPKSFPADSRFICGTKKYGPSGNRETMAAYATETYYYANNTNRAPLLGGSQITANFFSIFDTIPHRPSYKLIADINSQSPTLQVLPNTAFVLPGRIITLPLNAFGGTLQTSVTDTKNVLRGLAGSSAPTLSNSGSMYNKLISGTIAAAASVSNASTTGLNLIVSITSNCQ